MMQPSINDMLTVTDPTVAAKGLVDRLSTSTDPSNLKERFSNLVSELKGTEQFKLEVVKKAQELVVEQADTEVNVSGLPVSEAEQQSLVQSFDAVKDLLKQITNEGDANSSNDLIKQVLYSKGVSGSLPRDSRGVVGSATTPHRDTNAEGALSGKASLEQGVGLPLPNKGNSTIPKKGINDEPFDGVNVRSANSGQYGIANTLKHSNDETLNRTNPDVEVKTGELSNKESSVSGLVGAEAKLSVRQVPQKNNHSQTIDRVIRGESSSDVGSSLHKKKPLSGNFVESDNSKERTSTVDSMVKSTSIDFENDAEISREDVPKQIDLKVAEVVTGATNHQAQQAISKQGTQAVKEDLAVEASAPDVQKLPAYQAKRFDQGFVRSTEPTDALGVQSVSTAKDNLGMASSRFSPLVADISSASNYQEVPSQESHDAQVDVKRVTELQSLQKVEKHTGDVSTTKVEAKLAELGLVIKQAALGRIRSLNITLKPVELGAVEVAIDDVGGEIHIKMSAEKVETLETLQKQESEMRQSLNQQNATFSFAQQNSGNKKFSLGDHLKSNESDDLPGDEGMAQSEYVEEGRLRITI
tara:strand:+ start:132809 stop:134560 length:1752 start_codon:yes stop_codon:yes gene_type:complete